MNNIIFLFFYFLIVASDGPGIYPVVGTSIASGTESEKLMIKSGQIARITTGGPVPNGANAVVMVEDTSLVKASEDNLTEQSVEIHVQVNEMVKIGFI